MLKINLKSFLRVIPSYFALSSIKLTVLALSKKGTITCRKAISLVIHIFNMEMNSFQWFNAFDRKIKPSSKSGILKIWQTIRADPNIKMVSTFHLFTPCHITSIKRTRKSNGLFQINKLKRISLWMNLS